ncbi:Secologanin synthase [Handroanthus impetiginosus]|uniref:Secologanin synthase n=1 Tax=Handroanthus impetiginosus TaxID=429701 RepID=A0A2G9HQK6_9LAMI|nr:Secologanin synthase [Handroanthus impetiginosus]
MDKGFIFISIFVGVALTWAMKLLNWIWFRPRRLEKFLRQQGLNGNPYIPIVGDLKEFIGAMREERPKTIELSDDPLRHVFSYYHQILTKYGKNSFFV